MSAESPEKALILVVDDNHDNINVFEEILERFGFDYYSITDPRAIHTVLDHRLPDLVLLDLYMPGQSGLETLTALKRDPRYESLPVIMLTAETDKHMLSTCLDAGAMDYLNKPVDAIELQARIRSALSISRLTRALAIQNDELNRKNKELQKFTGTIVHDLKNPLTVITASIDFIRQNLTGQKQAAEFADMIKSVAFEMRDSINELLNLSRIQQGLLDLRLVSGNPIEIVETCLTRLRLLANKKSIRLIHGVTELPPVRYDEKVLQSLLINLIDNAIKFSHSGSVVQVRYTVDAENVTVSVVDQGLGMTEKDLALAFHDFQRLSARPTQGESSTGLGLAIVRSLAHAMGSEVGVRSEGPGKGSTFWFTLKRATL
jgi:signal transduction histidine kinase